MGCFGGGDVDNERPDGIKGNPGELDDGPLKNRSCRDIICLILFGAFLTFGAILLIIANRKGDLDRIFRGFDHYGDVCGQPNNPIPELEVVRPNSSGKDLTNYPKLVPVINRCWPAPSFVSDAAQKGAQEVDKTAVADFWEKVVSTVQQSRYEILYMCLVAVGLTVVITVLLRLFSGVIIWAIIIVTALGALIGTIVLWVLWSQEKKIVEDIQNNPNSTASVPKVKIWLWDAKKVDLFFTGAIVVTIFTTFLALSAFVGIWLLGSLTIVAAGDPVVKPEDDYQVIYAQSPAMKGFQLYHIFLFFWVTQFIIACQHVVVAGAIATWYFTRDKNKLGWPVIASFYRLVRFHLGSVAFGSLIIAIIQFIRYLLKKVKNRVGSGNALGCLVKCCDCCMGCFERIIKFISRHAYIEIAIFGYSFCKAARQAFSVLTSNGLRLLAINSIGDFILFLGKLAVVVSTIFIGIEIMKGLKPDLSEHMWAPIAIAAVFALLVAHCFLSIYEMAIDTLFICFCEDSARHDGEKQPYFMSKSLMEFVENSKRAMAAQDALMEKKMAPVAG
ncbi:unnamed protein product [Cyprideis torosa]|uniref:Choline transporter-like protein n=1 Tax=Cyprideis torosa TaxID=163714 RepID=A0A7R8ZFK3_9CRUS|nr:unnamed protein product [Cyprideis torosa]CAG0879319.1 unnamed protein product [Cyprideis torosa]